MKLLMVARRFPPDVISGSETVFENLYLQARQRHDVRLLVGYRRDRAMIPREAIGVDLRHAGKFEGYARLWMATSREVLRWRPDAVLANSIEVPVVPGTPTACIVHDLNFGGARSSIKTASQVAYYRFKVRRLSRVITVSEAMRRHLEQSGFPASTLVAIRNGVDLERFSPISPPVDEEVGERRMILSYPSRIIPGKGQHIAIDAVARLSVEEKKRVLLQIVGAPSDQAYLAQLRVQAWGQPVEFHIDVPDIRPWYQGADIVLFPTLMSEGFGFTAVEAMACGKPVIYSDQPAICEATGAIGLPVPANDPPALRDAIRRLLREPSERARLGEAGRLFVVGEYRWDRVWERYEQLLDELVPVRAHAGT